MSRLPSPTAVRHNRRRPYYVHVESTTVRNTRLSYRALGLLTYLLDQKEGWQVRSDQLSKGEGREGREAIRTSLRLLAAEGHYRLERRRLLNGKVVMGTAVSEFPVDQWIKDHEIFSTQKDPAVPVVEQDDGTFFVEYPDGSRGSDGFETDLYNEEPPDDTEFEPEEKLTVDAVPAAAQPEKPARTRKPRKTPEEKAAEAEEKKTAADERAKEKAALGDGATAGAQWWWGTPEKDGQPAKKGRVYELIDEGKILRFVGNKSRAYHAVRTLVHNALMAGYDRGTIATALETTKRAFPSQQQFEDACATAAGVYIDRSRFNGARGVPYNDANTWGDDTNPSTATPSSTNDSDDATFGVLVRP